MAAKASMRAELKEALKKLTPESIEEQSNFVYKSLISSEKYQKSRRIGVYLSMPTEVQTDSIVKHMLQNGKECFIPRYNVKEMVMVRLNSVEDFETLPRNKWNIRQPLESDERENSDTKGGLELIIVPGLGFSNKGDRIGRGKGYYDRFLIQMDQKRKENGHNLYTLGLAFKEQVKPSIPTTSTDYKLDEVLYKN